MEGRLLRIKEFIWSLGWKDWKKLFLVFLLLTVIIIAIGSSVPMSSERSTELIEDLESLLPDPSAQPIFSNNFGIAAMMFTPIIGMLIGFFALFNTGVFISAMGTSLEIPGTVLLLALLIFPFAWLEFISYAIAMTQGVFLIIGLIRKNFRRELIRTGILLAAVFIMLLAGAFIEVLFI
jgi:hypothetical protein